jgi:FkbM family methyltransferase
MNNFIYKNKSSFLKAKRFLNSLFGLDIIKYPTPELSRRIAMLNHYNIDVVLDVGANIGQYASELRNLGYKNRIISFEPLSAAFQKLKRNAAGDKHWNILNVALGERDGESIINVSENSVSSSLLDNLPQLTESAPRATFQATETIHLQKLDTLFEQLGIVGKNIYLKIDAQGYEEKVLDGAVGCLDSIKGIQIEMAFVPMYADAIAFDQMRSKLNGLGFELIGLENGFYDKKTGKQLEVDGIFYRKS